MTQTNGHTDALTEIGELADKIQQPLTVLERVRDTGDASFEQKTHTLMLESVDKITQQWINELVSVRDNTMTIEQMVIEHAAKVKSELTKLHLLGTQAMLEAKRGHEVLQQLGKELDAMMAERAQTH